jgi:hypothetical protein
MTKKYEQVDYDLSDYLADVLFNSNDYDTQKEVIESMDLPINIKRTAIQMIEETALVQGEHYGRIPNDGGV